MRALSNVAQDKARETRVDHLSVRSSGPPSFCTWIGSEDRRCSFMGRRSTREEALEAATAVLSPVAIRRILKGNFPTSSGQDFWSDVFGITARSHLASPTAAG